MLVRLPCIGETIHKSLEEHRMKSHPTPEAHIILLTNVTPVNSVRKKEKSPFYLSFPIFLSRRTATNINIPPPLSFLQHYTYCSIPWFFSLTLSLKYHFISVFKELPHSFLWLLNSLLQRCSTI